jgi:uncharacterized protein (TIGR00106 family)
MMFLFPFAIIKINRRYIILSDVQCNYIMGIGEQILHAEISVIPIGTNSGTSMSKEIASVFDAIRKIKDMKTVLTAMGTQIETNDFGNILKAIEVTHQSIRSAGAKRIITTIRIDERLDKSVSLEKKVESVMEKL